MYVSLDQFGTLCDTVLLRVFFFHVDFYTNLWVILLTPASASPFS